MAATRDRRREARDSRSDADDALATLRERYVAGEIDEAAFEARLERLLAADPRREAVTAPERAYR